MHKLYIPLFLFHIYNNSGISIKKYLRNINTLIGSYHFLKHFSVLVMVHLSLFVRLLFYFDNSSSCFCIWVFPAAVADLENSQLNLCTCWCCVQYFYEFLTKEEMLWCLLPNLNTFNLSSDRPDEHSLAIELNAPLNVNPLLITPMSFRSRSVELAVETRLLTQSRRRVEINSMRLILYYRYHM